MPSDILEHYVEGPRQQIEGPIAAPEKISGLHKTNEAVRRRKQLLGNVLSSVVLMAFCQKFGGRPYQSGRRDAPWRHPPMRGEPIETEHHRIKLSVREREAPQRLDHGAQFLRRSGSLDRGILESGRQQGMTFRRESVKDRILIAKILIDRGSTATDPAGHGANRYRRPPLFGGNRPRGIDDFSSARRASQR